MDKKEAIQFLRESLSVIPELAKSNPDSNEYLLWRDHIEDVLEEVWGCASTEYKRFLSAHSVLLDFGDGQKNYLDMLKKCETAILSIIQKYEVLGLGKEKENRKVQTDTTITPIQLFDAMQFHQNIVSSSRALFENGHYSLSYF